MLVIVNLNDKLSRNVQLFTVLAFLYYFLVCYKWTLGPNLICCHELSTFCLRKSTFKVDKCKTRLILGI